MSLLFRRRKIALTAALSLLVAGCSGAPAAGGGATAITVYTGSTGQLTANFNPFILTSNQPARGIVYEPLMFINRARADEPRPMLAEDYRWNDDGTAITFDVREGVQWHDGEAFTSEDVVFTFELMQHNDALNTSALPIESVEANGESEVTITFDRPAYTDLETVAGSTFIVPEHIWSEIDDPATFGNAEPVGTGAFALETFSAQSYELTAHEDYWDGDKPYLDSLRFVSHSGNQSALSALTAGQIDWASIFIPDIENTYASRAEGNHYEVTPVYISTLGANLDEGPTSDVAVRQAIYRGIDRDQVNELNYDGLSTPTTPGMLMLPREEEFLTEELRGVVPSHEPAEARSILEDAGYTEGADGIYVSPDGEPLRIEVKVVTGYTDQIATLDVMRQQLAEIGIDLAPREVSHASFVADRDNGNFELVIDNLYGGATPFTLYEDFFASAGAPPIGSPATKNFARFRSDIVDEALEEIAATQDEEVHREAYGRIQTELAEQLPYIPILQSMALTQFDGAKVTGFPTQDDPYALPMTHSSPDLGVVAANLRPAE
ncbi:ABC transporter substrate-binding protein [Actinoalloteichus hymeniacidonis]|uniref:ABC-type dipeptide transport system, periplasmic component n=1 Tax=Actinoalloteichus hymeniacidonis TaxID=340345 RepID=A0AAC9HNM3_9PSEU|nr:ABC transporter substrate-binding protein [Actinoalloteichus hymeniacidonis]AOS62576.1 ABC-type dipeptide transport system, periplasmic component [Actinoalloteichus hymeniacidonis]MBB5909393.1 peptide/nickel transport system substrate-binding protein [Actinoalloteichus hymeniacidonis]